VRLGAALSHAAEEGCADGAQLGEAAPLVVVQAEDGQRAVPVRQLALETPLQLAEVRVRGRGRGRGRGRFRLRVGVRVSTLTLTLTLPLPLPLTLTLTWPRWEAATRGGVLCGSRSCRSELEAIASSRPSLPECPPRSMYVVEKHRSLLKLG